MNKNIKNDKLPLPILNGYNYLIGGAPGATGSVFTNLSNYKVLIDKVISISNVAKQSETFTDPPKKAVDDIFTGVMNKTYITTTNLLNDYFDHVYDIFGDLDSGNLIPTTDPSITLHNIKINDITIDNSIITTYNNNTTNNLIDSATTYNKDNDCGYFIFKGGNIIKYWTVFNYLDKIGNKLNNIQSILNSSVKFRESGAINSYSDFDYTYYINNLDDDKYKKLLKHLMIRMNHLRNKLEIQINNNTANIKLRDVDLHYRVQKYLSDDGKPIPVATGAEKFDMNIILSTNTTDSIITKKTDASGKMNIEINTLAQPGKQMNVTFNNTIKVSNGTDFDLFRIKLGFESDNNVKKSVFKSEIFDLTVMRPSSVGREAFCRDIDHDTVIIKSEYNGKNYFIRAYNIEYTLKDILSMLFITNQPLNTIFLWADKKYNKRVIRMGILYAEYIHTIPDPDTKKIEFFKAYLLLNYIKSVLENLSEFINCKSTNVINDRKLSLTTILVSVITHINSIDNLIGTTILSILLNNQGINIFDIITADPIDLDNIKTLISNKKFIDFVIIIITVYIKKIFIENDIKWCSEKYYGDGTTKKIDLCDFQKEFVNFIKIFATYLYTSMANITNLFETFSPLLTSRGHTELTDLAADFQAAGSSEGDVLIQTYPETGIPDIYSDYSYDLKSDSEPIKKIIKKLETIKRQHGKVTKPQEDTRLIKGLIKSLVSNYSDILQIDITKKYNISSKLNKSTKEFLENTLKLVTSIKENYIPDTKNKFQINHMKNGSIHESIDVVPKIINQSLYENKEKLDELVEEHFQYISKALSLNADIQEHEHSEKLVKITDEVYDYM